MKGQNNAQIIEPSISKEKFDREIEKFKKVEQKYRKKGVLLLEHEFPTVILAFAATKLKPMMPIAFSVMIDFTNYDLEPPSVKFINPFTKQILKRKQIPIPFTQVHLPDKLQPGIPPQAQISSQPLLQGDPESVPFFCIPGVKEYHNHPYHSGDSWFLYRTEKEGELITLVDQLYDNGIVHIRGYEIKQVVGLNHQVNVDLKGLQ